MRTFLLAVSLFTSGTLFSQYLHLLHTVTFPTVTNQYGVVGTSDCWGYVDIIGNEYAIVGNKDNIAIVRAHDGQIVDQVEAPQNADPYYHRDMKTYGHYLYVVGECTGVNEGLTIIDLSPLPDSVRFVGAWTNNGTLVRSHNVDIDEGRGVLYIESDEFQGPHGVEIVDISSPENPVKVGFIPVPGVHDMNARNDTVWVAEGYSHYYSMWNCSNPANPSLIARVTYPNIGYCHNIWPSDDGKFFFTAEETANRTVKCWDASDSTNVVRRGEYSAANHLAHNVHVEGHYIYISHYTSGVAVVDWSDPDNLVGVGSHDTYPLNNNASFFGCWGVYPHSLTDFVYASNMDGQLFIYEWLPTAVSNDPIQTPARIEVGPNPVQDELSINLNLQGSAQLAVTLFDMQGRLVAVVQDDCLMGNGSTVNWRVPDHIESGTYLLQLQMDGKQEVKKLVVSR